MRRFKSYIKEDGHEDVASVKKQIKIMDNRRNLDSEKIFPNLYKEVLN